MIKLQMNPRKRSKRSRNHGKSRSRYNTDMMDVEPEGLSVEEQRGMLADNIHALLGQEKSGVYDCEGYLSMTAWPQDAYQLLGKSSSGRNQADMMLDEYCREQLVEWTYRVSDYFRIDREVVALSLSLLDRFLMKCRCDRTTFKLAATTTLNLSVKLLHPCKLGELGILSDLSRGEFDMKDVALMEKHILQSLGWNLHPPTPIGFASLLLDYIFVDQSTKMTPADIDDLYDITAFFTELAVCDYYFVSSKASHVALACVLNALEGMFGHDNSAEEHVLKVAKSLSIYSGGQMMSTRHRLWELYERSEECALHNKSESAQEEKAPAQNIFVKKAEYKSTSTSSPVAVANKAFSCSNELAYSNHSISPRNGSW